MAILSREVSRVRVGGAIIECHVGYVAATLQLLEHVVTANLSALVDRMKQFSF
jgi:hypothetical protein